MGANACYTVKVLRTVEDTIEVSALHAQEAREMALREPGVVHVLDVRHFMDEEAE